MSDPFASRGSSVMSPSRNPFSVTPHDTNPLSVIPKAIRVGQGGTLVLRGVDASQDVTLINVANGEVVDIRASHIRATGTSCSAIVALA